MTNQLNQGLALNNDVIDVKSIHSGAEINPKDPSPSFKNSTDSRDRELRELRQRKEGKDFQIYTLNIENKRLNQENEDQRVKIEELEQDLDYLQESIKSHLPMISELEVKNQQLEEQMAN